MLTTIRPEMTFDEVSECVVSWLQDNVGLRLWSVNRVQGGDQLHLTVLDSAGQLGPGLVTSWDESLCTVMASGVGPTVAPDVWAEPAYRDQQVVGDFGIRTYVGAPIHNADGGLFGGLCGIDNQVSDPGLKEHAPTIRLLADLLSVVLKADRDRTDLLRQLDCARDDADTDVLTGLANRRAWDRILAAEEAVQRRFGDQSILLAIDVDGLKQVNDSSGHAAGDRALCSVAEVLRECVRADDVVARIGGDEFTVLLRGASVELGEILAARLGAALDAAGVPASIGSAPYVMADGMAVALAAADAKMYAIKRQRRGTRERASV